MTLLGSGADLPTRVKDLSNLPGKKFEATRRSVVALSLIWFALTHQRFCWDVAVSNQSKRNLEVPDHILARLEEYRGWLLQNPTEIDVDLFICFQRELTAMDSDGDVAEEMKKQDDDLESRLDSMLYQGEVKLGEG